MINDLNCAKSQAANLPDAEPIEATYTIRTGRRGRPKIEIDKEILEESYHHRGPTDLGEVFGVSSRSVRQRALDAGITKPGQPVYVVL